MSCKLSNYSNNFCKLILRILHSCIKKILSDKIIMRVVSAYKNTVHTKRNYLNNGSIIKACS